MSVLLISLIKPPGVSADASRLSYSPGLGYFQTTSILHRAVFNADILQCNLAVHSQRWGQTIFREKYTHIRVFWGARSHLLCAPKHPANLPVSRTPRSLPGRQTLRHPRSWGLTFLGEKGEGTSDDLRCGVVQDFAESCHS